MLFGSNHLAKRKSSGKHYIRVGYGDVTVKCGGGGVDGWGRGWCFTTLYTLTFSQGTPPNPTAQHGRSRQHSNGRLSRPPFHTVLHTRLLTAALTTSFILKCNFNKNKIHKLHCILFGSMYLQIIFSLGSERLRRDFKVRQMGISAQSFPSVDWEVNESHMSHWGVIIGPFPSASTKEGWWSGGELSHSIQCPLPQSK